MCYVLQGRVLVSVLWAFQGWLPKMASFSCHDVGTGWATENSAKWLQEKMPQQGLLRPESLYHRTERAEPRATWASKRKSCDKSCLSCLSAWCQLYGPFAQFLGQIVYITQVQYNFSIIQKKNVTVFQVIKPLLQIKSSSNYKSFTFFIPLVLIFRVC